MWKSCVDMTGYMSLLEIHECLQSSPLSSVNGPKP
jgi:hypothetical protein